MNEYPLRMVSKTLILFGLFLIALGIFLHLMSRTPRLGKLPGDIFIQKGNFSFYFPVVTCLIVSLIMTFLINLFKRQ